MQYMDNANASMGALGGGGGGLKALVGEAPLEGLSLKVPL